MVIGTKTKLPFNIVVRNFSDNQPQLPKKTVLTYVNPNPLALVTLPARIYNKMVIFLWIIGASETEEQDHEVRKN